MQGLEPKKHHTQLADRLTLTPASKLNQGWSCADYCQLSKLPRHAQRILDARLCIGILAVNTKQPRTFQNP